MRCPTSEVRSVISTPPIMQPSLLSRSIPLSVVLLVAFLASSCGHTTQPPPAISLERIPAELGEAFTSAKGETKDLSGLAVAAVQSKEFSKAAMALDALARRPD